MVEHSQELILIAREFGATRVCLCGSVARGTDTADSDIDFYVFDFDEGRDGRKRAEELVRRFRSMCPYPVDVRGIPGWLLDGKFESSMQRDAIPLETLARSHD